MVMDPYQHHVKEIPMDYTGTGQAGFNPCRAGDSLCNNTYFVSTFFTIPSIHFLMEDRYPLIQRSQ